MSNRVPIDCLERTCTTQMMLALACPNPSLVQAGCLAESGTDVTRDAVHGAAIRFGFTAETILRVASISGYSKLTTLLRAG